MISFINRKVATEFYILSSSGVWVIHKYLYQESHIDTEKDI